MDISPGLSLRRELARSGLGSSAALAIEVVIDFSSGERVK